MLHLLDDLIEEGIYYYLYGEDYLDEVGKDERISRKLLIDIKKAVKRIEVSKYMKFTLSERYGKEEIYNMIKILEYKEVFILCIVYNPKSSEFCMIFKGSPNDSSLERFINDFLEMESY